MPANGDQWEGKHPSTLATCKVSRIYDKQLNGMKVTIKRSGVPSTTELYEGEHFGDGDSWLEFLAAAFSLEAEGFDETSKNF